MGTGTAGGTKPSTCARRLFHNQVLKLACLEKHKWLTSPLPRSWIWLTTRFLKWLKQAPAADLKWQRSALSTAQFSVLKGPKQQQGAGSGIKTHCKDYVPIELITCSPVAPSRMLGCQLYSAVASKRQPTHRTQIFLTALRSDPRTLLHRSRLDCPLPTCIANTDQCSEWCRS